MCAVWRGASMGRQGSVIPTIEDLSDPGRIGISTASAPLRHALAGRLAAVRRLSVGPVSGQSRFRCLAGCSSRGCPSA